MKWQNHLEIADAVAEALALPPHLEEVLRQASIEPDKHGERLVRFDGRGEPHLRWMRHHRPEAQLIESLARKGRIAFLEGRDDDAVWCLGKALHFLQDDCVSTGLLGTAHGDSEEAISRLQPSRERVASGARGAEVSLSFMRECVRSAKPCRDPEMALGRAELLSGALSASILRGRGPGKSLMAEWQEARHLFWWKVVPATYILAILAMASSLLANEPLIAMLVIPSLLTPLAYRRYWFLREEMAWFDLEGGRLRRLP